MHFLRDGYVRHKKKEEEEDDVTGKWRFCGTGNDLRQPENKGVGNNGRDNHAGEHGGVGKKRKNAAKQKKGKRVVPNSRGRDEEEHGIHKSRKSTCADHVLARERPRTPVTRDRQAASNTNLLQEVCPDVSMHSAQRERRGVDVQVEDSTMYLLRGSEKSEGQKTLEGLIEREMRVTAKKGIAMALFRPPSRSKPGEESSEFGGLLQFGVVLWSAKVVMERFQIFAASMERFSRDVLQKKGRAPLRFQPSYDVIKGSSGFSEVRVGFPTAMDLFHFLGITRVDDIKTLLWRVWNKSPTDIEEARIIGAAQIELCGKDVADNAASFKLFLGNSCASRVSRSERNDSEDADRVEDREKVICAHYKDTAWDVENNCFSHEPELRKDFTLYKSTSLDHCSCFQITWEVEKSLNQRTLSHVAMDSEGVRNGKIEVQMPYFLACSEVQRRLSILFGDTIVDDIIKASQES